MNADSVSQTAGIAFSGPAIKNAASYDAAFYVSSVQFSDPLPSETTGAPVLHLRPHHLLCLQTFTGHGYSEEFVRHMTTVQERLFADPLTPIELVHGVDELCAHCPNNRDGHCTSENPALFDAHVLSRLRVSGAVPEDLTGSSSAPRAFSAVSQIRSDGSPVLQGIPDSLSVSASVLEECCPGCEWKPLCREWSESHKGGNGGVQRNSL